MTWFISLSVSLFLTLAIELTAAWILRKRGRALKIVALVNLLTNPLVVSGTILWRLRHLKGIGFWILFAEAAAFAAEALIYRKFRNEFSHPWIFSLLLNGMSFGLGFVLQPVITNLLYGGIL